ncbi:ArsC family transcriptional regulator [Cephaloticoccus primus]|uniref:ArsC family transcriptional regulator n=1 Tax=Cephaloticoccus primus TaxID=1548207 RepID=A0A139SKK4_9BACT|nr:arsenate reductase family protein [Cephaloticoccus primus]KXU35075.1 ArsC family transcriptional regulator [Cephaloticoccus primus]
MSLKLYTYAKCSTCRNAAKWLRARGIDFAEYPIRETPPSVAELRQMLAAYGGELRRIFNTSGMDYRAQGLAQKLPAMSEADALALLTQNGNLVRRPFLIGEQSGPSGGPARPVRLIGFKEPEWAAALSA